MAKEATTLETQNLIYERRVRRLRMTGGVSRSDLINKVNSVTGSEGTKKPVKPSKPTPEPSPKAT